MVKKARISCQLCGTRFPNEDKLPFPSHYSIFSDNVYFLIGFQVTAVAIATVTLSSF